MDALGQIIVSIYFGDKMYCQVYVGASESVPLYRGVLYQTVSYICMCDEWCVNVQAAVEGYKQIHPGFEGTRELKLIQVYHDIAIHTRP